MSRRRPLESRVCERLSACEGALELTRHLGSLASVWCRLNWGGFQSTDYLLKLMQLKYPTFPGRLTPPQAHAMYKQHSYHSLDYEHDLAHLSSAANLAAVDRIIQFPFADLQSAEKTQEELAIAAQKRVESGRRLQAQAAQQRLERMAKQEEELVVFGELRDSRMALKKTDYEVRGLSGCCSGVGGTRLTDRVLVATRRNG